MGTSPQARGAAPDEAPAEFDIDVDAEDFEPRPPMRRAARAVRDGIVDTLRTLTGDRATWVAGGTAAVVLTVSRYHASTGEYFRVAGPDASRSGGLYARAAAAVFGNGTISSAFAHATGPVAEYVWWFLGSLLLFFAVPLAVAAAVPGVRPRDFGIGAGDWRFGLGAAGLLYAVFLPFVVGASFTPAFANHYPLCASAASTGASLLVFELCYAAYFIGWEFLYRGLLCVGLYPRIGVAVIVLHTIPFAVMHGGKPEAEAYGSIIAGIVLGALAVRARSFWYGALLHAAVALTMDALALAQTGRFPKAW